MTSKAVTTATSGRDPASPCIRSAHRLPQDRRRGCRARGPELFDVDAIRPTVLIVEAVAQLDFEPTHSEWEGLILEHGFVRAAFDGINCFYVAAEDSDLVPRARVSDIGTRPLRPA